MAKCFLNCVLLPLYLTKHSLPLIEGTPIEVLPKDTIPAGAVRQRNADRVKGQVLHKQGKGEYVKHQVA